VQGSAKTSESEHIVPKIYIKEYLLFHIFLVLVFSIFMR